MPRKKTLSWLSLLEGPDISSLEALETVYRSHTIDLILHTIFREHCQQRADVAGANSVAA